jgi:hypothetical protein
MATGDFVIRNIRAVRWSGSNGALVAQLCNEIEVDDAVWTVTSEMPGDRLVLSQTQAGGANPGIWVVLAARPWVLVSNDFAGVWAMLSDATYETRYTTGNSIVQAAVDGSVVQFPTYALVNSSGEATVPAMLLGGTANVVVTLRNVMPSAGYNVTWRVTNGVNLLSQVVLQAGKTLTKTPATVTVPLRTTGLASVAGLLTVEASLLLAI